MKFERSSGILLHPTSLPGPYGIGDLGPQAHRWVDFLTRAGCSLWQVLPLGPTGYGDSPYQCFSAFAGNPYLVSPEALLAEDLLHTDDLVELPDFTPDKIDFGRLIPWKLGVLDRAFIRFQASASKTLQEEFVAFQANHASWLDDFALFMALKEAHGGAAWPYWPTPLRHRHPSALNAARKEHAVAVKRQVFRQFLFFRQWATIRQHATSCGVRIIGDIPIFVAHDSADVWVHPELFHLDEAGLPTVVAGVPPDYFSPTGQLWGNPLYRWEIHAEQNFTWWIERVRAVLDLVDLIRLDHFRGFAGYWEIPVSAPTAETGRWLPGPGEQFFSAIATEFIASVEASQNEDTRYSEGIGPSYVPSLPFIAEDLGVITPDVVALRERFGLPGMKILQFAFSGDPQDPFLPHNYPVDCVVYTGTHDNDTARGWYQRVPESERDFYRRYLDRDGSNIAWDLIRACWASVAVFALAPLQDFLDLDNTARMNYPGNPQGNWNWRMPSTAQNSALEEQIKSLNHLYSRTLKPRSTT